ncbi:MAG: hypothetical protein MEQ07_03360 [Aquimonas sp.]|nr:hypothetical protein [Aquimonas sp.]
MTATADEVINDGLVFGGLGGAAGVGRNFAALNLGAAEGLGGDGGDGGDGVVLATGASLDNRGEIHGGFGYEGGNGGANVGTSLCGNSQCDGGLGGQGGRGGAGVRVSGGSLANSGRIEGGWGAWGGLSGGGRRIPTTGSDSGDGGDALVADAAAVITHTGTLLGGPGPAGRSGTNGGLRSGGDGGAGARVSGGSLLGTEGTLEAPATLSGGTGGDGGTGSSAALDSFDWLNHRGGRAGDGGVALRLEDAAEWSPVGQASLRGGDGGVGGDNGLAGQELTGRFVGDSVLGGAGGAGGAGVELLDSASVSLLGRVTVQGGRGGAGGACALNPSQPNNVAAHGGAGGPGIVLRNAALRWTAASSSAGSVRGGNGGGIRMFSPGVPCGVAGLGGPGVLLDGNAVLRSAPNTILIVGGASGAAVPEAAPGILVRGGGNELVLEGREAPAQRAVSQSGDLNGGDTLVLDPSSAEEIFDGRMLQTSVTGTRKIEGFRRIEKRGPNTTRLFAGNETVTLPFTLRAGVVSMNSTARFPNMPLRVAGGTLTGTGELGVIDSEATVDLRSNPNGGFFTLRAAAYNQSSGTLQIAASGGASPANARLEVSGAAQLAGTLRIDFAAPPQDGQVYTVLTAASLTGRFDSVVLNGAEGLGARVEYGDRQPNAVTLVIDASLAVPELFKNGFE